jgi:hypothetical protein
MNSSLLSHSGSRSRFLLFLALAVALHGAAVAIASLHPLDVALPAPVGGPADIVCTLAPPDDDPPPPQAEELDPAPPPPTTEAPEFPEPAPTPVRTIRRASPPEPLLRPATPRTGSRSSRNPRALAIQPSS